MRRLIPIAILTPLLVAGVVEIPAAEVGHYNEVLQNINTIEVDTFDHEGFWSAKFSRFRSVSWDSTFGQIPQYRPVYSEDLSPDSEISDSKEWLRWLGNLPATEHEPAREIIPAGLVDMRRDQLEGNVLGVRGNWDYPGYNWVIVEPSFTRSAGVYPDSEIVAAGLARCPGDSAPSGNSNAGVGRDCAGKDYLNRGDMPPYPFLLKAEHFNPTEFRSSLLPAYVQIPGQAQTIDFWAWGKGYDYDLELHVEDFYGNAHILAGPNLNYFGWRAQRFEIPSYIPQSQRYLPQSQGVRLIRIKIVSSPGERPDDFHTYFDYMSTTTDLYVRPFYGDDLVRHPAWLEANAG